MAISAFAGPLLTFGADPFGDSNGDQAPSVFQGGVAIADLRTPFRYRPGQSIVGPVAGWAGGSYTVIDQVPSAIAANNIAASQTPVAGTPLTLVAATGAGISVGASVVNAATGATVTGLRAIDTAMGRVSFGDSGTVQLWDPTKAVARNVRITSVGDDSGATFAVAGYDIYGYALTETITGANATVASGKKAFKYIASITPAGTLSGSAVTVGTGDVIGFPIQVLRKPYVEIWWDNSLVTDATWFVAADTNTATATTGDVRGTIDPASATDGTRRLVVSVKVQVGSLAAMNGAASVFGMAQF